MAGDTVTVRPNTESHKAPAENRQIMASPWALYGSRYRAARPQSVQQMNARHKQLRSVRARADEDLHLSRLEYRIEVEP